jgi:flagellar assembly protein FliH
LAKVISSSSISGHTTEKYNFNVFPMGSDSSVSKKSVFESKEKSNSLDSNTDTPVELPEPLVNGEVDSSSLSTSSKDSLIESLLKKTDEMSSNFIKLQMRLEEMSDEHKLELEKMKDSSFED